MVNEKKAIIILIIATAFSFSLNEIHRSFIIKNNPNNKKLNAKSLVFNSTIWSIDNSWYLPQVRYFFEDHGYTLDPENEYMKVRRTPGYSIFFGLHYYFFGPQKAFYFIRFTQVILFALSALLLAKTSLILFKSRKVALTVGLLYGTSPYIAGYNYFTITEAIHPALVVFCLFFFVKGWQQNNLSYLVASGVFLGITVLTRPLNGLIFPILCLVLLYGSLSRNKFLAQFVIKVSIISGSFLLILTPWAIRNFLVTGGEVILLEKFYREDPMDYGKGHVYFRKWWSCWDNPKGVLLTPEMKSASTDLESRKIWISNFIRTVPEEAYEGYGEKEVRDAIESLMSCIALKKTTGIGFKAPNPEIPTLQCEELTKHKFQQLIYNYKKYAPFSYYIKMPLLRMNEFIFHSNTSIFSFLNPENRQFKWWQVVVKGLTYLLNVGLFVSTIALLFVKTPVENKILLVGFPMLTLFFLSFYIIEVEARYMLQTIPSMYCSTGFLIILLYKKFYSRLMRK